MEQVPASSSVLERFCGARFLSLKDSLNNSPPIKIGIYAFPTISAIIKTEITVTRIKVPSLCTNVFNFSKIAFIKPAALIAPANRNAQSTFSTVAIMLVIPPRSTSILMLPVTVSGSIPSIDKENPLYAAEITFATVAP